MVCDDKEYVLVACRARAGTPEQPDAHRNLGGYVETRAGGLGQPREQIVFGGDEVGRQRIRVGGCRLDDLDGALRSLGIDRAQRLVAGESVVLETGWQPGTACGAEGALGREQSYPGVLVCRQGAWRVAARGSGGGYMQNSRRGCKNAAGGFTGNLYTGGCNCPAGFSAQQVAESGLATSQDGLTAGYVCLPPA